MKRTTIMLPLELKHRAEQLARQEGVSLAELIRESLEDRLSRQDFRYDPFFSDDVVFEADVPAEFSKNHDKYLYGEE